MHASGKPSHLNEFGLVNGFPPRIEFSWCLINLGPITMNEYGSIFIDIKSFPGVAEPESRVIRASKDPP